MSDKERLEIIKFLRNSEKMVAPGMQPSELISRKDVDWLIKQAEKREYWMKQHRKRANELEDAYFKIQLIEKQLQQAQAKAERYKQALEEISNADWNSEGLDAERELDKVTDVAFKALERDEN